MAGKSKYMVCATAVGFAGILGAFSLSQACDKCAVTNVGPTNYRLAEPTSNFSQAEPTPNVRKVEQTSPTPGLTKLRNDKPRNAKVGIVKAGNDKAVKRTSSRSSNQAVLAKSVRTLLNAKCVRCHGGNTQASGLDLRSRLGILTGGDSGPSLIPGKPEESLLFQRARDGEMPPGNAGQLSPQELATLKQWITAGAP